MIEGEEMKTQIGEQFIHTGTHSVDAAFGVPKEKTRAEKYRLGLVLKVSIVLFALATIGVSSWGIYESVQQTNSTVSEFWDLYRMVEVRANQTLDVLTGIGGIAEGLDGSLDLLVRNEDDIVDAANAAGLPASTVTDALGLLRDVRETLVQVQTPLDEAIEVTNTTFVQGLLGLRNSVEPPTMEFEETGRFIAIAVLFGLVILFSGLAGILSYGCRFPRWTSTNIIFLWFFVMLLMFLGVGLLKGVNVVTTDGCLYAETFVFNYALERITNPLVQQVSLRVMRYYLDESAPVEYVPGEAVTKIIGDQAGGLFQLLQEPQLNATLNSVAAFVQSPVIQNQLGPSVTDALQNAVALIPNVRSLVEEADFIASRSSVFPLYEMGKTYICCTLADASNGLFVAWTTTGCLSLVLATLCTIRIITFVNKNYKLI